MRTFMITLLSAFFIGTCGLITGCADDPDPVLILPSNLSVEVEEDDVLEGLVTVTATAANANFYTFIFELEGDLVFKESKDGKAAYQYTSSGTFSITVRANATYNDYVESSQEIDIAISDPIGNGGNPPSGGYETPLSYDDYTLVWNDEFNGSDLSSDWVFETGTGNNGWGNQELQYYREENTSLSGGNLIIEARAESFGGREYTSSRIKTQGNRSFQYGRIDIRAATPYGQGLWPALWMLGDNISSEGWPACGEIDIMEMVGGTVSGGGDDVVHGTAHWDNDGTKADFGGSRMMSEALANQFHVYSLKWDSTKIEWLIDDQKYHTIDITPSALSEFQQPFFFIFNVAVGGLWPGSPNAATVFPQRMYVDYVRVFQQ
jgi:hypothetical protein